MSAFTEFVAIDDDVTANAVPAIFDKTLADFTAAVSLGVTPLAVSLVH